MKREKLDKRGGQKTNDKLFLVHHQNRDNYKEQKIKSTIQSQDIANKTT